MKKKADPREPSPASLRAIPPVDFAGYRRGRRNPFAKRMKTEGWELAHPGPSLASLRAIPELGTEAQGSQNPYADRIAAQGVELQVGRHRPPRGSEVGPTEARSVRLPPAVWRRLERQARARGIALHALVRAAVLAALEPPRST